MRHAEKEPATMSSDVPLSDRGRQQAIALKEMLQNKNIRHLFSTNYNRTVSTAQPLSTATGIPIEMYNLNDGLFINKLKGNTYGNVLIVGHSNTVDDLVNALAGKLLLQDLPDAQYGDLFIVTKRGRKYTFSKGRFGL